jgi:hypothetical protein
MPESEDFKEVLFGAAVKADALRAAGLRGLEGVTLARQAGLDREHARLSRKLGAEHPRAMALAARMQEDVARLRDLRREIARAETVAPAAGAATWVLHGYVWSRELNPAPDLTVTLVDAQGQWVRALGFATTDARGYFQLVASLGRAEPAGRTGLAATAAVPPKLEAHIRITDRNRLQLYRGEEAVPVSPGGVEYREIVLEGGAASLPPEEDVPGPTRKKGGSPPKPRGRLRRRT